MTNLGFLAPERPAGGSAATRVFEDLRRRIIALELPPGTPFLRAELAQRYDVSQTPIREAMQRLEQEGLVKVYPQSKTVVTKIDVPQIYEAHFLRTAVEIELVRRLAEEPPKETLARARSLLRMQDAVKGDPAQMAVFQELDEVFHQTLFDGIGQGGIHALIRARSGHLNRLRRLDPPSGEKIAYILRGHGEILDGIEARDPAAAMVAMRDHLSRTVARVEEQRAAHPDFFS
ncbi:GntR family transcriptional regulator [Maritimibacter alkaliphilus]|uniref:GntR family transcriptional regulator n=1 Tax=Maritimibacter alkaliphilus TaxID=404236 RepID=UPI001C95EBF8|nr:GntR family transcriptional regulator [Maritimibacter alkaliphilus]MBY6089921.1 GntR family transcriptional regulator [Maritimibacter alkaliphilus]